MFADLSFIFYREVYFVDVKHLFVCWAKRKRQPSSEGANEKERKRVRFVTQNTTWGKMS